jgi:uncharacterized membrane protein
MMQHHNWHDKHKNDLSFGQRAADIMRNGMGSWPFVGGFLFFMALWAMYNGSHGFDPYPFILLNLFLSMLAGLQGAILLIAAKRQDQLASAMAKHDFDTNVASYRLLQRIAEVLDIVEEIQEDMEESSEYSTGRSTTV